MDFKQTDKETAVASGFGAHPVSLLPNCLIPLPDGCHLAAKFWMPFGTKQVQEWFPDSKIFNLFEGTLTTTSPQPVILEYLPYRKDDYTFPRDHRRHNWMCSHGYIIARVDFRGTGDSEGLYWGEYLPQEQLDCCHLLEWLEKQSWCSGNIGMFGKSWGGFNSLEVAYCQPPQLKTAISLYSSDDRYASDIHYSGGCIIASEMLSWASVMFAWNARPPTPYHMPKWQEEWKQRLEKAAAPWVTEWLEHQHRDDFWKHGSICEDYAKVNIPILAIGGWKDCYRDTVFRMAAALPKCRGVIGPWSHEWPDVALPGPQIDFLDQCLAWWDCFLKDQGDSAMTSKPLLRLYLQEGMQPQPQSRIRDGKWVNAKKWPSGDENFTKKVLILDNTTGSLLSDTEGSKITASNRHVPYSATCGLWHGEFLSFGGPDLPNDQRHADGDSTIWTTDYLDENINILGNVVLTCSVSVDSDNALLVARLCDVFPDGSSALITYGVLNLTHREGHETSVVKATIPGEVYAVKIEMQADSYIVSKGHRLRLGVSTNYWPLIWPSPSPVAATIYTGRTNNTFSTYLTLPVYNNPQTNVIRRCPEFRPPRLGPPVDEVYERQPSFGRHIEFGLSNDERVIKVLNDSGRKYLPEAKVIMEEVEKKTYYIRASDPLSARATVEHDIRLEWPDFPDGPISTRVVTNSEMTADKHNFHLTNSLTTWFNGDVFYKNSYKDIVKRKFV